MRVYRRRKRVKGKARRKLEFKVKGEILRSRERLKGKRKKKQAVLGRNFLYIPWPYAVNWIFVNCSFRDLNCSG